MNPAQHPLPSGLDATTSSPELDGLGGLYCENCDVARVVGEGETVDGGVRPWAIDPGQAERLWSLSERLTGVKLGG